VPGSVSRSFRPPDDKTPLITEDRVEGAVDSLAQFPGVRGVVLKKARLVPSADQDAPIAQVPAGVRHEVGGFDEALRGYGLT
jgi:hypothetical protein